LILFATILFAAGEPITRRFARTGDPQSQAQKSATRGWWTGAIVFQFVVAIYGGYFGAGMGILMLAALGLMGLTDIHQMNGLKNFFAVCINIVAAAYFIASGRVSGHTRWLWLSARSWGLQRRRACTQADGDSFTRGYRDRFRNGSVAFVQG
jgi:uncharacterized membrane protein YfcA